MRWEALFADLESQLEAQLAADLRDEIVESVRVERARQTMAERLLGHKGFPLHIRLSAGREASGIVGPVSKDYVCLEDELNRWLIRFPAIRSIPDPRERVLAPALLVSTKFPAVVRGLMRDRQRITVADAAGMILGEGVIEQAAQDFLVLAIHPRDEFARSSALQSKLLIPYAAVGWIGFKSNE